MSVIFTDTDCELWYTEVDKYDIKVIAMPYTIDGEEKFYDMGRHTDFHHFYERMRDGAMPITSALNPQIYIDYFEPYFAKGEDILYVHFSDKMSATFNYMETALNILQEKYPKAKFTTFNTLSICAGAGIQALEAAKLHAEGKSIPEIVEHLKSFTKHSACLFAVESLSYLKRGGRISSTKAAIGTMLQLKPVIGVGDDGTLHQLGTQKGMKKAMMHIADRIKANAQKIDKYPIWVLDADAKGNGDFMEKQIKDNLPNAEVLRYPIGPVIGSHCGPGTVGVIYYAEERLKD